MILIRALFVVLVTLILSSSPSSAQIIGVSIRVAPPPIPVYVQPVIPGPGYIWVPGYWAWDDDGEDYYWVPGTWVLAPTVGYLWTPGYWGWSDGFYVWHRGYWGPRIGFYGGCNYGYGYYGSGFVGGYWRGGVFAYNTAVTNIGTTRITNVYVNKTVIINNPTNNVSFNGGPGGTNAKATTQELAAEHDKHIQATDLQLKHEHAASTNRELFSKVNAGKPIIAATPRAGQFTGKGVISAKDAKGSYNPALNSPPNTKGTGDLSKGTGASGQRLDSLKKGTTAAPGPDQFRQQKQVQPPHPAQTLPREPAAKGAPAGLPSGQQPGQTEAQRGRQQQLDRQKQLEQQRQRQVEQQRQQQLDRQRQLEQQRQRQVEQQRQQQVGQQRQKQLEQQRQRQIEQQRQQQVEQRQRQQRRDCGGPQQPPCPK